MLCKQNFIALEEKMQLMETVKMLITVHKMKRKRLPSGNEDSISASVGELTMQSYQTISRCETINYEGKSDFEMA